MQMNSRPRQRGVTPPLSVSLAARRLADEIGETAAVDRLGFSRQTFGRLIGRLGVNSATIIVAAQRLGVDLAGEIAEVAPPEAEAAGDAEPEDETREVTAS
jgi:hypothetical protein